MMFQARQDFISVHLVVQLPHVFFRTTAMAPHHPQPTTPMQALVVLMKNYLKWWAI